MSEQEQAQALLHAITHQPALVPADQMGQSEVDRLMQQVLQLQAENDSLKAQLSVKSMNIAVQGQKIEQLTRELQEKEEAVRGQEERLRGQQKKMEAEQVKMDVERAKIDKLTTHLQKVERLLQKLLAKKGYQLIHEHSPHSHIDRTKLKLDMDKLQGSLGYSAGSYRSSTDSIGSLQSPPIGNITYARLEASPSSLGNYQSQEYRRYRREKLLSSQTVGDVLKLDRLKRG